MRILLIDDEELILESHRRKLVKALPEAEIIATSDFQEALDEAEKKPFHVAFLDVEMPGMTGVQLAEQLREMEPKTNIVFLTAYKQYALDALELFVSAYVLKPLNQEKILQVMENLRYPIEEEEVQSKFWVQCFGKFEVYYDNCPVVFSRRKAKELLAYLIDQKGASANNAELCAALWEDEVGKSKYKYLWTLFDELKKVLSSYGMEELLIHQTNSYAINYELLDCDYYRFLKGKNPINVYQGEYMSQYSWGELTNGWLCQSME